MADESAKFIKIPEWLVGSPDVELSDKLIYGVIQDHVGQNDHAWPSIRGLARRCSVNTSTVLRSIRRLSQAGMIEVETASGNPAGKRNHYRLRVLDASACTEHTKCVLKADECVHEADTSACIKHTEPDPATKPTNRPRKRPKGEAVVDDPLAFAVECMSEASELRTSQFSVAWNSWVEDRRERKTKLTKQAIKQQIKMLEVLGHDGAIECIEQSIRNGWTGLFKPNNRGAASPGSGKQPAGDRRADQNRRCFDEPDLPPPILP